jgi:hypothetical protein
MWVLPLVRSATSFGPAPALPEPTAGSVDLTVRRVLKAVGAHARRSAQGATAIASPHRSHFDGIVDAFFIGYRAALETISVPTLVGDLSRIDASHQGFAFEGAGMALTALDLLMPFRGGRFEQVVAAAPRHIYLLHVGAGWALVRFRCVEGRVFRRLDPLLRWLAVDGAGFHEGYFAAANGRRRARLRRSLSLYGARAFDQGLGRSLWFTADADPERIAAAIANVEPDRHADLWSGVGLACAYAGGIDDGTIEAMREASGPYRAHLAQGAAFAAEAHVRASGHAPRHTEQACRMICGMTAGGAAATARDATVGLGDEGTLPAYEVWRRRVRLQLNAVLG